MQKWPAAPFTVIHDSDDGQDEENREVGTHVMDEYPTYEEWIAQFDIDTDTPDMAKLAPAHEGRLPVWVEGNAYLGGAKACKNEINGLVNGEQPVQVEVELENGRPVLSTNVYELLEGFTGRRIDTQVLGKAFEPEEYFENPDGTPITFDQDYFGDHRGAHPLPGPFAGKDAVGQPLW